MPYARAAAEAETSVCERVTPKLCQCVCECEGACLCVSVCVCNGVIDMFYY